jgi:hypothetical protein
VHNVCFPCAVCRVGGLGGSQLAQEKSRKAAESATVLRTLEEILQKLSRPEATMVTEME